MLSLIEKWCAAWNAPEAPTVPNTSSFDILEAIGSTKSGQLNFRLIYVTFFITDLLAPAHLWQLRTLDLVLFEQIAWPGLDFPSYRTRTELRLNCQVFNIDTTNQRLDITCLDSVASAEVQAETLDQCRSCQGTCRPLPREGYREIR